MVTTSLLYHCRAQLTVSSSAGVGFSHTIHYKSRIVNRFLLYIGGYRVTTFKIIKNLIVFIDFFVIDLIHQH